MLFCTMIKKEKEEKKSFSFLSLLFFFFFYCSRRSLIPSLPSCLHGRRRVNILINI